MLRLRGSVTVDAVDIELLQDVVEHVLERWRQVRFEDGAVLDPTTGTRREGLRVTEGTHPEEGCRYALASAEPAPPGAPPGGTRPGPRWRTSTVEVRADRPRRLELQIHQAAEVPVDVTVVVSPRDRPERLAADVDARLSGHWAIRGRLRIEVEADLGGTGGRVGSARAATFAPTIVARAKHRRGSGRTDVSITPVATDRWAITVEVRAHGRGLFRPVAAVGLRLGRRAIRMSFQDSLDGLVGQVTAFNESLRTADGGARSADDLAEELLHNAIESVPEAVPDGI